MRNRYPLIEAGPSRRDCLRGLPLPVTPALDRDHAQVDRTVPRGRRVDQREGWTTRPRKLAGPIEFDETYVGGVDKNRSYSQRRPIHAGTAGKFIVIGVRDRNTGLVYA